MSEHQGPERPEDVGSVGEEAAKLFGALSGWARDRGGDLSDLADHAADAMRGLDEHLAGRPGGAPECQWCPVCRTVHAIREVSPEVRDHLATAAASLMQAAAGVLAATAQQHGNARQSGVEHIDLDPEDQA